MRNISLILVSVLLFSCGNSECNEKEIPSSKRNVDVIVVDSCEYITIDNGYKGGCSIIHKNNCKFCAKNEK